MYHLLKSKLYYCQQKWLRNLHCSAYGAMLLHQLGSFRASRKSATRDEGSKFDCDANSRLPAQGACNRWGSLPPMSVNQCARKGIPFYIFFRIPQSFKEPLQFWHVRSPICALAQRRSVFESIPNCARIGIGTTKKTKTKNFHVKAGLIFFV